MAVSTSTESYAELKAALKDALTELLQEQRGLFRELVREVLDENGSAQGSEKSALSTGQNAHADDNVQAEIEAYHRLHPTLWEKYPGEHVAIHSQKLVDHDPDYSALYQRIDQAYPQEFVLLRLVEEEPERDLYLRSPRLVKQ